MFFFSCISVVSSNANEKRSKSDDTTSHAEKSTYPCVSYFIVYEENENCNDDTFFSILHNQDLEPQITPINVRIRGNGDMETAARQLFQVLKDPKNESIQDMVNESNTYCYEAACDSASEVDSGEDSDDEFYPVHFPIVFCVLVIANHQGYLREFETAIAKLESDGLVLETTHEDESHIAIQSAQSSNELISTVRKVERVMELCSHALYRGHIYARPDQAQLTYAKLMDVSSYLNKLLANDTISKHLLKHFKNVENILAHPACEMIQQLEFDYNLIEVSNGFCFYISQRAFVSNAINESQIGKLSPRAYVSYDCSSSPRPGYFREGVLNSFPNEEVRLNFLNKFFQCLVPFKMPQKTRKLCVPSNRAQRVHRIRYERAPILRVHDHRGDATRYYRRMVE